MNNQEKILLEIVSENIAVLTLNRPEKRNSLTIALMESFCYLMEKLSNYRVIIIKGAGNCFCSGMNLDEVTDPVLFSDQAHLVARTLTAIYKAKPVTIAAVHGFAVAGGAGLMAACDFVIASHGTSIGFPEVRLGIVPAQVMAVLKRQIALRHLRELLLLGSLISAEHAKEIGLVNTVVNEDDLMHEALHVAEEIVKGGPRAIKQTKFLIEELSDTPFEDDLQKARDYHLEYRLPKEAEEGILAWKGKRQPKWSV